MHRYIALLFAGQGGEIHPITFDLYAYERNAAHEVKEAANESREAYFEYKEEQQEVRDAIAEAEREAERIENMARKRCKCKAY